MLILNTVLGVAGKLFQRLWPWVLDVVLETLCLQKVMETLRIEASAISLYQQMNFGGTWY